MQFSVKEIREKIASENDKAQACMELAEAEGRGLTAFEASIVNAFHGIGDDKGELGKLMEELKQAEKIEAHQKEIVAVRFGKELSDSVDGSGDDPTAPVAKIVVPAQARRHGKLRAFQGPDAERDAYVAGHCFAASLLGNKVSAKWLDDHGIRAALSGSDNLNGGVLVPVETENAIIRLVEEYGVFRRFARVEPMMSDRKVVPVRVGGLTAYPVAETTTLNQASNTATESNPTYTNIELVARKWKTTTRMSQEFSEDAMIAFAEQISMEAALAFAIAEDSAGFLGDGTSTYHGIQGLASALAAGSVYTAATGNTAFSTLDLADFEGMLGKLPDYPGINPAWHISKEGYYASMSRLMNAAGGQAGNDIANGGQLRFLGIPVVFNQVTNKTLTAQTSTRLFYLGDLNMGVRFGDRRGVTISSTEERYWDVDQIGIKATERFDIAVHSKGDATNPGAILALETPGS